MAESHCRGPRGAGPYDYPDLLETPTLEFFSVELELPLPQPDIFDQIGTQPGVVVYYAATKDFEDMGGLELLTPERRERIRGFKQDDDKVRTLVAGLLLRSFVSPKEPLRGEYGKPYFREGPFFSISHAGRYVVLAVAGQDVGVDVELIHPWAEGVAARCFTSPERDWLARQTDQFTAFYKLWTAKEAVMKATGEGFHMPPETIRVFPQEATGQDAGGTDWYLSWMDLPDHIVCAAVRDSQAEIKLQQVSRQQLLDSPEPQSPDRPPKLPL